MALFWQGHCMGVVMSNGLLVAAAFRSLPAQKGVL